MTIITGTAISRITLTGQRVDRVLVEERHPDVDDLWTRRESRSPLPPGLAGRARCAATGTEPRSLSARIPSISRPFGAPMMRGGIRPRRLMRSAPNRGARCAAGLADETGAATTSTAPDHERRAGAEPGEQHPRDGGGRAQGGRARADRLRHPQRLHPARRAPARREIGAVQRRLHRPIPKAKKARWTRPRNTGDPRCSAGSPGARPRSARARPASAAPRRTVWSAVRSHRPASRPTTPRHR